ATAWVRLTDPWGLVSVGSVVFIAVLGFNLIGEGLRLRLNQEVAGGVLKWLGERTAGFFLNVDHYITYPLDKFFNRPVPYFATRLIFGLLLGATAIWGWDHGWFTLPEANISFLIDTGALQQTPVVGQNTQQVATPTPRVQVISGGAEETPPPTPLAPQVVWTLEAGSVFTGAPVVAPDGTIYANTSNNLLHALAPDGSVKWQFALPARGVESPALAADGTIYVTDREGALNAISPAGEALWRFTPAEARAATSGPVIGSDGNIYYASGSQTGIVQAVSPAGEGVWRAQGETSLFFKAPVPVPDAGVVFLWDDAFSAGDGTRLALEFPSDVGRFLRGNDGKLYARLGHNLVEWQLADRTAQILSNVGWDYTPYIDENSLPQETGVTKNGISWELYTTEFGGSTSIFWTETIDGAGYLKGMGEIPLSQGHLVYMDDDTLLTVICGLGDYSFSGGQSAPKPECHALLPNLDDPIHFQDVWMIQIPQNGVFVGGVYAAETDMLYFTTEEGTLYAVDPTPAAEPEGGTAYELPTTPVTITDPVKTWEFRPEGGFAGAPVAAADGTIYVVANEGKVSALGQDGVLRWETALDPPPGAGALLTPNGLLVPDLNGGLAALDANGTILWQFAQPVQGLRPASRPVVASSGVIYYTVTDKTVGYVQAVSATGEGLWLSQPATTSSFYKPPVINTAGDLVFLAENVFDATNGSLITLTPPVDLPITPEAFITGENGKDYLRQGNTLFEWRRNGAQIEVLATIVWQFRPENADNPTFNPSFPEQVRVAPDGKITLWYRYHILWLTETGETLGLATSAPGFDTTISAVVDVQADTSITCGITLSVSDPSAEVCMGFQLGDDAPVWKLSFGSSSSVSENVLGGVRTPAGFAFASQKGILYGIMETSVVEAWEAAKNQPPAETGNGSVNTGSGWRFTAPEPLLGGPLPGPDGFIALLGESQTLYILSPGGQLTASFPLPT
ncbi:MAG TPA: PQQ-binding-like beta-propeller repeat protein, partial [Anaerolineales bacterium]|nr:PQQ-binding-like beta-propeller repeat protein [Anaerolineales bacterium]